MRPIEQSQRAIPHLDVAPYVRSQVERSVPLDLTGGIEHALATHYATAEGFVTEARISSYAERSKAKEIPREFLLGDQ